MSQKSQIRKAAEAVLSEVGIEIVYAPAVFVDTRASGQRVKFAHTYPGDADMRTIRRSFAALYPTRDTRVCIVNGPYRGYGGIAFKVFNDGV